MIESSLDILYVVLALSVVLLTSFLCWLLYQAARTLRNVNDIVESISEKIEQLTEIAKFLEERIDKMTSSLGVVGSVASTLVEKFVTRSLSHTFEKRFAEKEQANDHDKRNATSQKKRRFGRNKKRKNEEE